MSWKKIITLAFLLAILVVAIVYVDRRAKGKLSVEGILLDIPAASVVKVELRNREGNYAFSRRDLTWYMQEPQAAKADKVALESILDNFCRLKYDRLVAENSRDLKDFGLDRPASELKLFTNDKQVHVILLGKKNSLDDSSYVKLAAGGKVVSIAAYKRNDLEKGLFAFRDKKFLEIDPTAITAMEYRLGASALAFSQSNGQWFLEKPFYSLAQEDKVNAILAAASSLEALSFVPASDAATRRNFGLEEPLLTAAFHSAAAARKITIGKKGERLYAWVEGAQEICEIPKDFPEKFSADAASVREKKAARFYAFDVKRLEWQRGPFHFSVRKNAAGTWDFAKPLAGKKPSQDKIERLLTALADCEAKEFIDSPRALPAFAARATLQTEDAADPEKLDTIVLEFGEAEGETVAVRNPALPYILKVGKEIVEKLPGKLEDIAEENPLPAASEK